MIYTVAMKNALLYIIQILFFLITFTVIELNKNTLLGWILNLVAIALYFYFKEKYDLNRFLLFMAYIVSFILIVFISWPPYRNIPAVSNSDPKPSEIIETEYGKIQGVLNSDETVEVFAGIPYAKAPVGSLRWKEPQDPEKWDDVYIADHFGPMSMQETNLPIIDSLTRIIGYHDYKISFKDNFREAVSEDSLYLNVFRPKEVKEKLPVVVFIHGGSLQNGQSSSSNYNGENFAREDIVFVSITYRLGVFGFLADDELIKESQNASTGNYGMLDMVKALEWVHDNIAYFGGDPENVTIAGESAGSAAVSALCTSPLTKGLFSKAILESSTVASTVPPHSYRQLDDALASGQKLKERYSAESIDDLRNIPADKLAAEASTQHHMTVDGYFLDEDPYVSYTKGIHNEIVILHGYNSAESGPFILFSQADMNNYEEKIRNYFKDHADEVLALYPAENDRQAKENWAEIYSAVYFTYSHYCLNRLALNNDIPVYEYYFSKDNGSLGPWHSGEMIYAYRNIPEKSAVYDDSDRELSQIMSSYWINFIKTGDPNGEGLVYWPINDDNSKLLEFNNEIKVTDEKMIDLYKILDKMYGFE